MSRYYSEYEAWMRRERRRELRNHILHRFAIVLGGIALAVALYLALVGFYVVLGCVA